MRPAGFFVLRTPLLAAEEIAGADVAALVARPELRAALAEASPDLMAALDRGLTPKVEAAAARYLLRMAGRPTPFGRLAAVSVGEVGSTTRLTVAAEVVVREAVVAGDATPVPNPTARGSHAIDPETHGWVAGPPEPVPHALGAQHVDAARAGDGLALGPEVVDVLAAAAATLCGLTPDRQSPLLTRFAERFVERYGDVEIPLLEALDPEDGLGLAPPPPVLEWGDRDRRMLDAVASVAPEWMLSEDDLAALAPPRPRPLPPAFAVLATVLGDGRVRVHGISGPSGGRLFTRHAAADADLAGRLRAHLRAEEALDPGAVHAEVRLAPTEPAERSVMIAPPDLHEHVIDSSGGTSTLPPGDLLVRIADGRPVLRSRSLDRRVVPRLSSAHAYYDHPHDLYRFLGHLQDPHGDGWVAWRWGRLATAARLPRVRAGDAILAPAVWRRAPDDLAGLPRHVLLSENGRELPFDLASPLAAAVLRRAKGPLTFLEDLAALAELPVRSPRGRHRHDLIVPFTTPNAPSAPLLRAAPHRAAFKPGEDWTTVKLYCGPAAADDLLAETVAPALTGEDWFFLRYADPEWHLRVRLRGDPARLLALGRDPRVWRCELIGYVRETERYGDIEAAERAFAADSEAVCALLAGAPGPVERMHLAAAGVALLLADAGLAAPRPPAPAARADRDAVRALVARPPAPLTARSQRWRDDVRRTDARSLAHMHVNRLLREAVPAAEAAVYALLPRA